MIRIGQIYGFQFWTVMLTSVLPVSVSCQLQSSTMLLVSDSSGPLCAADRATAVFQVRSLIECQRHCTTTINSKCFASNFYSETKTCEAYNFKPSSWTSKNNCKGFKIYDTATKLFDIQGSCSQMTNISGIYTLHTINSRKLNEVYCDMSVNGGGYAFIHPADLVQLTLEEINAMFNDTNSFVMRVLKTSGSQEYGVLQQLPQYQNYPLYLSLNEVIRNRPCNADTTLLGPNFLYFGFAPPTVIIQGTVQGLQVNGQQLAFVNCDANKNSYMALFPNTTGKVPHSAWGGGGTYSQIVAALKPSTVTLPTSFFMFYETHWGGCGGYAQLTATYSNSGVIGVSIGFR